MGPPGQPWAGLSGFWGFPPFLALVETVAVAVHLQDMNVVCEPVQQRPSQALGTAHRTELEVTRVDAFVVG